MRANCAALATTGAACCNRMSFEWVDTVQEMLLGLIQAMIEAATDGAL